MKRDQLEAIIKGNDVMISHHSNKLRKSLSEFNRGWNEGCKAELMHQNKLLRKLLKKGEKKERIT